MDPTTNRSLDPFARLPCELCAMILSLLPDEDLITASHVSSYLRSQCLSDSLYTPLVRPRLEGLLQGTISFPRDTPSRTPTEIKELVYKLSSVSGTSYFDNVVSVRDFFFRQHFLKKSWNSGRPHKIVKFRSSHGHRLPIDRLVIDPAFNQVISADCGGLVCFSDVETGTIVKALRLESINATAWEVRGGSIALKGDVLLIRIHASRSIHICIRDPPSVPAATRGFTPVASFSAADPIHPILLEGNMCIVGCWNGAVEFWDLHKEEQRAQGNDIRLSISPRKRLRITQQGLSLDRNSMLYYRRPCLLLSSPTTVRISPRNKDHNNALELWDYSAEDMVWEVYTHVTIRDNPPCLVPLLNIVISPVGRDGGVLVHIPHSGVFRIDGFWNTVGHTVEGRLLASGPKLGQLGNFAAVSGYFLAAHTQDRVAWHRQPKTETIIYLYHENGDPIAEYVGYSPINEIIMDPCFFVSVGLHRHSSFTITDFRPQCRPNDVPSEANNSSSARTRCTPKVKGGSEDISLTPSLRKRVGGRNPSMTPSKKIANASDRGSAGEINVSEHTYTSADTSTQLASSADTSNDQPQRATVSWGEAAIRALISHPGGRGGLSSSEILGLVLWSGLREITAGEEEDVLREVGEALGSASQSSSMPVEKVAGSRGSEPKYKASRSRTGGRR